MEFIKSAWRGEERLWKVWWIWGVVISIVLTTVLLFVLGDFNYPTRFVILPYIIWWLVAAWRCSPNVDTKVWGILAKVFIVLGAIGELLSLAGMFLG